MHIIIKQVTSDCFLSCSSQRRLHQFEREAVGKMLKLKVNKKLMQDHISRKSGHVVLLKDLHNIGARNRLSDDNNVSSAVDELKKSPCEKMRIYIRMNACM